MIHNWVLYAFVVYVILFVLSVVGFAIWRRKRSRAKPPMEFKLLRGPGETQRRRVAKFDEDFVFIMGGAALAAWLPAVLVAMPWAHFFRPDTWPKFYAWLVITLLLLVGGIAVSFRWALRQLLRYQSDRLGYLGERAVGEALTPLERKGFCVFHDVPADANGRTFNLDHVAVGPTGVFAIETKTRSKGRARPGFKDHEVTYDGQKLIWPWGEDQHGLAQAEAQARWLKEWLHKRIGLSIEPQPILAIPGWWVTEKGLGRVRVLNPKTLATAIIGRNKQVISSEQIDLISRQLDTACRDDDW